MRGTVYWVAKVCPSGQIEPGSAAASWTVSADLVRCPGRQTRPFFKSFSGAFSCAAAP